MATQARLAHLPAPLRGWIQRASDALGSGDDQGAQAALKQALSFAPSQPDVLRLYGLLLAKIGNVHAATANFEAALRTVPDEPLVYWQYAQVCEEAGDIDTAWKIRDASLRRLPDSPTALFDVGAHLARQREPERALAYLERAVRLAPEHAPLHLKLGDVLVACGRVADGAAAMRRAIALEPAYGAAWISLTDIKTVPVTDAEAAQMRALLRGRAIDEGERTAIEFALARVCEARGKYDEAFALLVEANARRKQELSAWDVERFARQVRGVQAALLEPGTAAEDPDLGKEVIFVVGMPRSGTTLVEQILASHPEVCGAGELGDVAQVLTDESARLHQFFPDWVPSRSARDWTRMGQCYLARTARFRTVRRFSTDKMPNNWQAMGAIRAMLPGARIIICRRDPLENCWSCFKQYFDQGWVFSYDFDQLGTFWKAFDQAASTWSTRDPAHVHEQGYERLTENPEAEIRSLLAFCGLSFDRACLAPHQMSRSVNTLSAAQVRQPLHRHRSITAGYGARLDPLRAALGLPSADKGVPSTGHA
ncbi:MAG: sulfotransferase family protein [Rhodanobacteraceae bacterium]|nr:MAG: sulfotransferase family protein [Rhodanobacteraceae bacterium]